MFAAFSNCFKIPELRKRILFTLGMIFVCRLVAVIPAPGVNAQELERVIAEIESKVGGGFFGLIDMFSGGALRYFAVGALGIMPYISASIILQLLTAVIPALERLAREGDSGRQKLTQYGRYLTVFLCVIQGFAMALTLEHPESLGISSTQLVLHPGMGFRLMTTLTMTAGTMFIMWLGEQITQRGIGNGISLVITEGIVSRLPAAVVAMVRMFKPEPGGPPEGNIFQLVGLLVMLFLVVAGTIAVTQAQRKVIIQYAKQVRGNKTTMGGSTYMPLRINYSGVMPIIFAQSILMFPAMIFARIPLPFCQSLGSELMQMDSALYLTLYGLMILFFSYFWVATQFHPVQIADDLKKYGGYVPGIRPGKQTAEFLDNTMTRITLAGAVFLTVIAVIPTVLSRQFGVPWVVASFFGGTSLLIIVGVMLDTMRQIESHLLMRHYDGFLTKGRMRGRR